MTMEEGQETPPKPSGSKLVPLLVILLVIAAFVSGSLWSRVKSLEAEKARQKDDSTSAVAGQQTAKPTVNISAVDLAGEPFVGSADAPVTLAYWLDYQCPFCKEFDLQVLPALYKQYVETGKLKVVFKDFQFLGPDSQTAGLAAKAVWELFPDKYFDWHQAMFKAQDRENGGFGNKKDIIELTRTVGGIDAEAISRLMEEKKGEYQKEQDADKAEGSGFGVRGTPGFVIGTQLIAGAQPLSVFTQLIDAELNR
jgi:protein-disulfide isomerase